jgi:hypothetical protein
MTKKMKKKTHLIGVEDLQEIVKLIVASGFLKDYKPLSLLLVGKVGHGKTEIISSFSSKNIVFLTDLSSTGVYKILENPKITHIIIADFTKVTMKARQTSKNLMTTLNSAMEEGLSKQELKGTSNDLKGRNVGIITSTTQASFSQNKKGMEDFGLTSRFVIVSFDYSDKTSLDIMDSIYKSEYLQLQYKGIQLKNNGGTSIAKTKVIISEDMAKQLNQLNHNAFRTQKQMQTLACCNALVNHRKEVIQEDVDKILKLNKFMNLNFSKI